MKERVTIVLNERELEKARLAARLEELLNASGITAGRIELTSTLANRLAVREPEVIVTDYVLGDVSTGLDLLSAINKKQTKSKVVFFTDEPSAAVALRALKNGAVDYFLMSSPESLNELVERIKSLLTAPNTLPPPAGMELPSIDDLIAESKAAQEWKNALQAAASSAAQITLLFGSPGSGRGFSAQILHRLRGFLSPLSKIDWRYFDGNLSTELEYCKSLAITGLDADDADLAAQLGALDTARQRDCFLYLITSLPEVKAAALRIFPNATVIEVPGIKDRADDFSGLIKFFTRHLPRSRSNPLSPQNIYKLSEMEWPGEVHQLVHSVLTASQLSDNEKAFFDQLRRLTALESPSIASERTAISKMRALATIYEQGGFRLAAIKLGCSVPELRTIVGGNLE